MHGLGKMADLLWLNVLTLLCCIPIVTIGASLTAMNYMALKIARNEECYIARGFFKSFRENFRQGTLIGLIFLAVFLVLAVDFYIMQNSDIQFSSVLQIIIGVVGVLVLFTAVFVFPVLAKFDNTVINTIKNAFFMSIMQFPKTILMILLYIAPIALFIFFFEIAPLTFLFGLSVPAWLSAKLYSRFFQKLEDQILERNSVNSDEEEGGEDERIFRDELDESLMTGQNGQ